MNGHANKTAMRVVIEVPRRAGMKQVAEIVIIEESVAEVVREDVCGTIRNLGTYNVVLYDEWHASPILVEFIERFDMADGALRLLQAAVESISEAPRIARIYRVGNLPKTNAEP